MASHHKISVTKSVSTSARFELSKEDILELLRIARCVGAPEFKDLPEIPPNATTEMSIARGYSESVVDWGAPLVVSFSYSKPLDEEG